MSSLSKQLTDVNAVPFDNAYFNRSTGISVYDTNNICHPCHLKYPKTSKVCGVCGKPLRKRGLR